jgi:hypothetical protein
MKKRLPVITNVPTDPNAKITLNLPIIPPSDSLFFSHRPYVGPALLPRWGGSMYFRRARLEEADHLKSLYVAAWNNEMTKNNPIVISSDQIRACIKNFSDGQIVGCEKRPNGGKASDLPVSMINIMLTTFDPKIGFEAGYEKVTGGRTFSTTMQPKQILDLANNSNGNILPIAFCVSIAVMPEHQGGSCAFQTLKYAVFFSEFNNVIPVPYSAPRGFAKAKGKNPLLQMDDYLHMTKPLRLHDGMSLSESFWDYFGRVGVISDRLEKIFDGKTIFSTEIFEKYQSMPIDSLDSKREDLAFEIFKRSDAITYSQKYGREMTIEDFCIFSGRPLIDPVIGMHVGNGARFIRDKDGKIIAVFKDSRPEDLAACGYNILLSYTYHPLFGHVMIK